MRIVLPVSVAMFATTLAGCGGGQTPTTERGATSETRVTILAVNPNVGRAEFVLSCRPAGGDMPSPDRACAALEETPELVTSPEPFTCRGGTSSWWDLTISGRLRGRAFHSRTSTCWTPQMNLIGRLDIGRSLETHLLPRRRQELIAGVQRTIPPGTLQPGDLVVCQIHGRRLEQGVPIEPEMESQTGYGGVGVTSVALTVSRHRDGSVTAACT